MHAALFSILLLSADPTPEQLTLLKAFRSEFVAITPGEGKFPASFNMGRKAGGTDAERPVHKITFKHKFAIAKYEVPQNLWEAVMGNNPSRWKGPRNSAEMFTFTEAGAFCEKATDLMRAAKLIDPKQRIRLPSEAEWEYCCRAGTDTVYSFGDDETKLGDFAWFTGNAAGNDPPVGAKKPNPWGLYDMHGYLREWCEDSWHENYELTPATGRPWISLASAKQPSNVMRGGSWKDKAEQCTSTYRMPSAPDTRDDAVGFRCVLE
jgi:formylglycine-generating enzyme required for sulfatase activity